MGFFSSIFKPVTSLVGGILGFNSQKKANDTNADIAQQQIKFQQDYAKNRLQWQVEDAKKAGLHPMVAAGLSPTSFSPVSSNIQAPDYSWVSDIGQNLDYAATKAKTQKQQAEAYEFQKTSNQLQLESLHLDNELKQMEIMSMLSRIVNTGPAAPDLNGKNPLSLVGGQDDSVPSGLSITDGVSPLLGASRAGNSIFLHLNPDVSDSITEDFVRNMVANIAAEGQIPRLYSQIARKFTPEEQEALKRGDAQLEYVGPSQIQFLWRPHMKPWTSKDGRSGGGKIPSYYFK